MPSTRSWLGAALGVTQVGTITVTAADATTTYTLTIGVKSVSTLGNSTVTTIAAALVAAWNAMQAPNYEFLDATAANVAGVITFTGANAGIPFTLSSSVSGGAGTIGSYTAVTACTGPNFFDNAANWTGNTVPVTGDTVYFSGGPSCLYNISQSGITLAALWVTETFPSTSQIGLTQQTNPTQPSAGYVQYRTQRMQIGATICNIATQSSLIRLDLTPAVTSVVVTDSGSPIVTGGFAIDLLVNSSSDVVDANKGYVGINAVPGDSGSLGTLNVGFVSSQTTDAIVTCGTGITVTTMNASGGQIAFNSSNTLTTLNNTGGTITLAGTGTVTTVNNDVGTIYHSGSGNVTTLNNQDTWYRLGQLAATLGTLNIYSGSQGGDPNGTYTYSNPSNLKQCRLSAGPQDNGQDVAWWNAGSNISVSF